MAQESACALVSSANCDAANKNKLLIYISFALDATVSMAIAIANEAIATARAIATYDKRNSELF